jgi:hypothetical protein
MFWRAARLGGAIVITAATTSLALGAGAPLDTAGFEHYGFGPLYQQHGWLASTLVPNINGAIVEDITPLILDDPPDKVVKVNRVAGVDNRWAVPLGNSLPSHRFMLVDWDMRVIGTGAQNVYGPFFGIEAYDDSMFPAIGLLGSLGVDATTGEVVYQLADTGLIANTGETVEFDEWYSFGMVFDFQLDQYAVYLNGERLRATGFVDRSLGLNHLTDADISAIAAHGDSASLNRTGTAYFDNLRVLDGVPGDFDYDGDVDQADLALLKPGFGRNSGGDADGDGDTDGNDYLIWQRNGGFDATPSVATVASAPEPLGSLLMVMASIGLCSLSRRWQRVGQR